MSLDLVEATAKGVLVLYPEQHVDDGDAYTLDGVSRPVPTTPPVVSALVPATAAHTDEPLEVLVQGSDFAPGDRVVFGGATPPTSFHDDGELAVYVDPADWSAGTLQVSVAGSRGPSNEVAFTVT